MSLSEWVISAVFLIVGLIVGKTWDFCQRVVGEWREWLPNEENFRVLDDAKNWGYDLDTEDENVWIDFYQSPPGRVPPKVVQSFYRWWHRERSGRKLQTYLDINGPPPKY